MKTVTIILLAALSAAAFARSPEPIPKNLAENMKRTTEELVLKLFKDLRNDNRDLVDFGLAVSKIAIYLDKGSIVDTRPGVLLEELTVCCNTPDTSFVTHSVVTILIISLSKDYKRFYDSFPENRSEERRVGKE